MLNLMCKVNRLGSCLSGRCQCHELGTGRPVLGVHRRTMVYVLALLNDVSQVD